MTTLNNFTVSSPTANPRRVHWPGCTETLRIVSAPSNVDRHIHMTTKKTDKENELQVVRWGLSTNAWRAGVMVLVLSMHPIGRQLLGTFGFEFPDQKKITQAAEQAHDVHTDVQQISIAVHDLQSDMAALKANNSILNLKVDKLSTDFVGFQVDFNKWKPHDPQ